MLVPQTPRMIAAEPKAWRSPKLSPLIRTPAAMATTDARLVKTTDWDAGIRERVKFMRKKATTDERRPR
jgi:hypothetical protein